MNSNPSAPQLFPEQKTTTSAMPLVAFSLPLETNQCLGVLVRFTAVDSAFTSAAGGSSEAIFLRTTGDVARSSSSDVTGLFKTILGNFSLSQPYVDIVANTSTQSADIRLIGKASTTIYWSLRVEPLFITTQ